MYFVDNHLWGGKYSMALERVAGHIAQSFR
jgi:hypothetical protein